MICFICKGTLEHDIVKPLSMVLKTERGIIRLDNKEQCHLQCIFNVGFKERSITPNSNRADCQECGTENQFHPGDLTEYS